MGKIPILTNIFQRGWNHQLDIGINCFMLLQFCDTKQYQTEVPSWKCQMHMSFRHVTNAFSVLIAKLGITTILHAVCTEFLGSDTHGFQKILCRLPRFGKHSYFTSISIFPNEMFMYWAQNQSNTIGYASWPVMVETWGHLQVPLVDPQILEAQVGRLACGMWYKDVDVGWITKIGFGFSSLLFLNN